MKTQPKTHRRNFSTLAIAFAMAAFLAQPAAAQTATNLNCKGCVKSKQVKNNSIKAKDLKNNAVNSAKVQDDSLTGADIQDGGVGAADIQDGAVNASKLGSDVTALGLDGVTTVHWSAFQPDNSTIPYEAFAFTGFLRMTALEQGCFNAQVQLPDGALISDFEVIVQDSDVSSDFRKVALLRVDLTVANPTGSEIADLTNDLSGVSAPNAVVVSTSTISDGLVDANQFAYYAFICLNPTNNIDNHRLYAARVLY